MHANNPSLLAAAATVLDVGFYFYTAFRVGVLRGKHGVKAPAVSGHPEFDRAIRVQLNTLEQLGMFLPLMWVGTLYPLGWAWLSPAIGVVWFVGRLIYMRAYMADPEKRVLGAGIGGLCSLVVLILATGGVVRAWLGA